jgi:hypothetical protein
MNKSFIRLSIRLFAIVISSLGVRTLGAYISKVVKRLSIEVK